MCSFLASSNRREYFEVDRCGHNANITRRDRSAQSSVSYIRRPLDDALWCPTDVRLHEMGKSLCNGDALKNRKTTVTPNELFEDTLPLNDCGVKRISSRNRQHLACYHFCWQCEPEGCHSRPSRRFHDK